MKDRKRSGAILQISLLIIYIFLSLLSLFKIKIDSTLNITNFYNQRVIEKENFDNLSSLIFYEFKILDKLILQKKVNNLEEYIFLNEKKEEIWEKSFYQQRSLGGYYIRDSSHTFNQVLKEKESIVKFNFEKEIEVKKEENKEYLKAKLIVYDVILKCEGGDEKLSCLWEEEEIKKIKVEGEYYY